MLPNELKKANRYHLTMLDMQEVKRFLDACSQLPKNPDADSPYSVAVEALVIAAIVAYCRPFKKSNSDGFAERKVKIDDYHWIKNNPDQIKLHELLESKRDGFIAHSDWNERSTELVDLTREKAVRTWTVPDLMAGLCLTRFRELACDVEEDSYYKAMAYQGRMYFAKIPWAV
jgi:hypothetical protein